MTSFVTPLPNPFRKRHISRRSYDKNFVGRCDALVSELPVSVTEINAITSEVGASNGAAAVNETT